MTMRTQLSSRRPLRPAAGFTLIEILLVIVILLLLASALVVFLLPQQEGAEKNTTKLLLSQVATAPDDKRVSAPYKLYSVGPDGQPDTDDDIKLMPDADKATDVTTGTEQ